MNALKRFIYEEDAQAMVEFALVALILVSASYGAIKLFSGAWKGKYNLIKNTRSGSAGALP
ncbi:MAG TPA: hypothetical protein DEE98_00030 [Elusimicrobia bacterium]|nr:MAG: hypothetical protein A2204_07300 [Elusimicrobia bacterium RIFOXYA1_FULL_47_7]OGS10401.1 MAG: hypothetical protein A2386_07090 [Elusimicrobia bacterium RIFOXYB1_FULL_48_9]OGS16705.1 MAG: hypothetical protein A2251_00795 [Elusimicrobia bacterium RIFOXYA2_FULL_47_53]OGS26758.1 MAG: hypothetical protein A2339_04050 [Elusimicrobia bacterium RIFOXYB12_FULL_50_12]OGS31664.1 MAG: hypothetical protein A2323_05625 [Elusimicrobia bacterium RIFOXYB2_FULL_46_23]HBU68752.1 hypothetical protein [Elus